MASSKNYLFLIFILILIIFFVCDYWSSSKENFIINNRTYKTLRCRKKNKHSRLLNSNNSTSHPIVNRRKQKCNLDKSVSVKNKDQLMMVGKNVKNVPIHQLLKNKGISDEDSMILVPAHKLKHIANTQCEESDLSSEDSTESLSSMMNSSKCTLCPTNNPQNINSESGGYSSCNYNNNGQPNNKGNTLNNNNQNNANCNSSLFLLGNGNNGSSNNGRSNSSCMLSPNHPMHPSNQTNAASNGNCMLSPNHPMHPSNQTNAPSNGGNGGSGNCMLSPNHPMHPSNQTNASSNGGNGGSGNCMLSPNHPMHPSNQTNAPSNGWW